MRSQNTAIRIFKLTAIMLMLVAVGFMSFGWIERERNEAEGYRVYSAYLSERLMNDFHDWPMIGSVQVVIADRTSGGNFRFRLFSLIDRRVNFDVLQVSTRASYLARNLFRTRVKSYFSLPTRAVVRITPESEYGLPTFQEKFPQNMGLVVLSGVGFNFWKTQAVFYVDHLCGLCGGGQYVLMEKVNGSWRIEDEHSTWIS